MGNQDTTPTALWNPRNVGPVYLGQCTKGIVWVNMVLVSSLEARNKPIRYNSYNFKSRPCHVTKKSQS
jgi:hypothetical protein